MQFNQPQIPMDIMDDLQVQLLIMEQFHRNADQVNNEQNQNEEPAQAPENQQEVLRQNIALFIREFRGERVLMPMRVLGKSFKTT